MTSAQLERNKTRLQSALEAVERIQALSKAIKLECSNNTSLELMQQLMLLLLGATAEVVSNAAFKQKACAPENVSLLQSALSLVYTLDDADVVTAVLEFWQAVKQWMLPPMSGSHAMGLGASEVSQLSRHIMGIHDMLCPLLCMMQGFHAIAGINPLAQIHAQDLIVVQISLALAPAANTPEGLLSHPASSRADGRAQENAVAALHALLCSNLTQILQLEEAGRSSSILEHPVLFHPHGASITHLTKPGISSTFAQEKQDGIESGLNVEERGLQYQCYKLWLWVLQSLHVCFHFTGWPDSLCGALLVSSLAAAFKALGGSEHQLACCVLSTMDQVIEAGSQINSPLADWFWDPDGGQRVLCFLSLFPGLSNMLVAIMSARGGSHDKKKGTEVLDVVNFMLGKRKSLHSLMHVCTEVIRPESSCCVETRMQALVTMQVAMDACLLSLKQEEEEEMKFEGGHVTAHADREARHASCWPDTAVQVLLFTIMHDPSARVRRCAMKLLSTIAMRQDSQSVVQLLEVLLSKMRDKDVVVRERALDLLVQLPPSLLLAARTSISEWAWLLYASISRLVSDKVPRCFITALTPFLSSFLTRTPVGVVHQGHHGPQLARALDQEIGAPHALALIHLASEVHKARVAARSSALEGIGTTQSLSSIIHQAAEVLSDAHACNLR